MDGGTRVLIEQNVMHDVDFGIELASEHKDRATSYITARNNLIYHGHTAGVSIGGYAPERGHTEHCIVVNNTLYDNDTSATGSGEFQMQWNMTDNIFANNIVYAGSRCLIAVNKSKVDKEHPPVIIDHNLYYCVSGPKASTWGEVSGTVTGFDNYVQSTGNDRHSRFLDPHFVDAAAKDYHLRPDSPAIGAGTTDGLPVGELDLEGSPRLKSGKIDLKLLPNKIAPRQSRLMLGRCVKELRLLRDRGAVSAGIGCTEIQTGLAIMQDRLAAPHQGCVIAVHLQHMSHLRQRFECAGRHP